MKVEFLNKRIEYIINRQFKIIGLDIKFSDIEELVEVGKKKIPWYEHYLFDTKEQYEEWRDWAKRELSEKDIDEDFTKIDLIYGLNYKIKKEGLLF